jgi:hypothetical protein
VTLDLVERVERATLLRKPMWYSLPHSAQDLPICMRRRTSTTLLLMLAAFLVPSAVAT